MFIDNAANAAFNAQTIGMILIIENEIFAQNIVEKRNGKEIFGKLAQRVAVEKRSGSLRSICRLLCTTSGDNVFSGPLPEYCNAHTPADSSAIAPKPTRP